MNTIQCAIKDFPQTSDARKAHITCAYNGCISSHMAVVTSAQQGRGLGKEEMRLQINNSIEKAKKRFCFEFGVPLAEINKAPVVFSANRYDL